MNPLLEQFVAEADELLASVSEGLLRLERDPHDEDIVNSVFRAAHTFKGSSGLFDLPELTALTHAAEDLLDAVRGGEIALTGDLTDTLLAAFDVVRAWMDHIAETGTTPPDAVPVRVKLAARLRAPLGEGPDPAVVEALVTPQAVHRAPDWLAVCGEEYLRSLAQHLSVTSSRVRAFHYQPEAGCYFRGEDPLGLVRQVPALDQLQVRMPTPMPTPEEFDEYSNVVAFVGTTRAGLGELEYLFRYVDEEVEIAVVDGESIERLLAGEPEESAPAEPAAASTELDERHSLALRILTAQLETLGAPCPPDGLEGRVRSAAAAAQAALMALESTELGADLDAAVEASLAEGTTAPLTSALTAIAETAGAAAPNVRTNVVNPNEDAAPESAEPQVESGRAPAAEADTGGPVARVLRVDQAKVDRLLEIVGELTVANNALPFLVGDAQTPDTLRLARKVKDQYSVLGRICEELQGSVMDIRMLPVSVAFARMPRLVRDLSRKLDKEVRLDVEGEDTQADKDVIEALAEPLIHLVRNSLDHGIETPDQRTEAGKPTEALLAVRATSEADAVIVEVIDDGRGIDPERVKAKAVERNLIDAAAAAAMSPEDAVNLVFEPGFSTAAAISDVSGRGVGMDAVRSSVERLGGSVALRSTPGQGSTVTLRLPLSMAVSQVMVIRVLDQRFGVPVDSVIETVRIPRSRVQKVGGMPVLDMRGVLVPIVDLAQLLGMGTVSSEDEEDISVLVCQAGPDRIGLEISDFHHNTDVIVKALGGIVAGTPGFRGTALLGDGFVLLVLDVKELVRYACPVG
ncbi:hypothetical protein Kisp01_41600 [Kineosporia sp. NBRC 101677]|uniref:chemotaxis protein CheA n=1 Tax=Kineosporia sp. NBRC 101677 TaxID=3032197 RepID=UPI0024A25D1D|nr:chemotaxis protein CheA [Kineosporia sp. NBRC 101677]GLY17145.1 hypothetical protein Kisp01_41600 [Kineosporia sp. NBRC 101677]